VAFDSIAKNLIEGVNAGAQYPRQVFRKNIVTGGIELVSKNKDGVESSGYSYFPSQSADGNKIAFVNYSSTGQNLVDNPSITGTQVYVKDMTTGDVQLVSSSDQGVPTNGDYVDWYLKISGDGNRVAFMNNADNLTTDNSEKHWVVFVKDVTSGKIIRLDKLNDGTAGNGGYNSSSANPALSDDGKKIAFDSDATNLLPSDANGAKSDILLKDFDTGEIILVSSDANGVQANDSSWQPSVSADGNLVAFFSFSTNLVPDVANDGKIHYFVKNIKTGAIRCLGLGNVNSFSAVAISPDGTQVAFSSSDNTLVANDTNGTSDLFLLNLNTDKVTLLSVNNEGVQSTQDGYYLPIFTGDGKKVFFQSGATFDSQDPELSDSYSGIDVYLSNLITGKIMLVGTNANGEKADTGKTKFDNNW